MSDKILDRLEAYFDRESAMTDEAITALYPDFPGWIPEPNVIRLRDVLTNLLNKFPLATIEAHAKAYGEDEHPPYPGMTNKGEPFDVQWFIENIGYLAHLRYAIGEGKTIGLKELAGTDAVAAVRGLANLHSTKKGGDKTGGHKKKEAKPRHAAVIEAARKLLDANTPSHNLVGKLRVKQFGDKIYTDVQLRKILQDAGILEKRQKKQK